MAVQPEPGPCAPAARSLTSPFPQLRFARSPQDRDSQRKARSGACFCPTAYMTSDDYQVLWDAYEDWLEGHRRPLRQATSTWIGTVCSLTLFFPDTLPPATSTGSDRLRTARASKTLYCPRRQQATEALRSQAASPACSDHFDGAYTAAFGTRRIRTPFGLRRRSPHASNNGFPRNPQCNANHLEHCSG